MSKFIKPQQIITISVRCTEEQGTQLDSDIKVILDKLSLEEINLLSLFIRNMSGIEKTVLLKELRKNTK